MRMDQLPTPCYVIDEKKLKENLRILKEVREKAGCKILLAQKAFSCFHEYPLIGQYLDGTTASGLYEARLGKEEMGKENHVFAPAYKDADMKELEKLCDHIVFNSFSQLSRHKDAVRGKSLGLRINPECSTQKGHAVYDPCAPGSRLGVTKEVFEREIKAEPALFDTLEGLHFHTLCEQNANALVQTLKAVEEKFGPWLSKVKWLNMGGGHHITREDYDRRAAYPVYPPHERDIWSGSVPGAGRGDGPRCRVSGNGSNGYCGKRSLCVDLRITSAACHMPDVLEMPYRPPLKDSGKEGEKKFTYRLSSCTCLAGDVIGDYSFDRQLQVGDRLYFEDMAIYSMVKNNTFNGIPLPGIAVMKEDGDCEIIRSFGYQDFKERLA